MLELNSYLRLNPETIEIFAYNPDTLDRELVKITGVKTDIDKIYAIHTTLGVIQGSKDLEFLTTSGIRKLSELNDQYSAEDSVKLMTTAGYLPIVKKNVNKKQYSIVYHIILNKPDYFINVDGLLVRTRYEDQSEES